MVSVERTVHDGGSHLQHQMSAPQRPAHPLLRIHSPVQQPLHRAPGNRRRDRFFTPSILDLERRVLILSDGSEDELAASEFDLLKPPGCGPCRRQRGRDSPTSMRVVIATWPTMS
jgi:hypothetical protein